MWYVITKIVVNCKNNVYLIKMVNFKVVVLYIKILTSKEVNIPGQKSHELNVRSVSYGLLWNWERVWKSMKTFWRLMNMTEPINIKAYNAIKDHLLEAYLVAADNSMS